MHVIFLFFAFFFFGGGFYVLKIGVGEKLQSCPALVVGPVWLKFSGITSEKDTQCILINKVLMYTQLSLC